MANSTPSPARLEVRIAPEAKALIQKAADLEGRTLKDFVTTAAVDKASRTIAQHQTLTLSLQDSEAFVEALLNPPQPNPALKAAAQRYRQAISMQWL